MAESTPEEVRFAKVFSECMSMEQAEHFNTALTAFLEHGRLRRFCLTIKKECDLQGKGEMLVALSPLLPEKYREPYLQFNEPFMASVPNASSPATEPEDIAPPAAAQSTAPGGDKNNPLAVTSDVTEEQSGHVGRMEIPRDSLTPIKPIGKGQFGEVYKCEHSGPKGKTAVAVKLARADVLKVSDKDDLKREASCMMYCSHPNVVRILGVCFSQSPWLMVLEYCREGSLKSMLRMCHREMELPLMYVEQLNFCTQIAAGMRHVAEKGFVHMDVATRNILVKGRRLKVADFGTSHQVDVKTREFLLTSRMRLPVRWMAPETLKGSQISFSEKTDVWSFGVTCWEIFSYASVPFGDLSSEDAKAAVVSGKILDKPGSCPQRFFDDVLMPCWRKDAQRRPTFQHLDQLISKEDTEQKANGRQPRDVAALVRDMKFKSNKGSKRHGALSRNPSTIEVGGARNRGSKKGSSGKAIQE